MKFLIQYINEKDEQKQFISVCRSRQELENHISYMRRRCNYKEVYVTEINNQGELLYPKRYI